MCWVCGARAGQVARQIGACGHGRGARQEAALAGPGERPGRGSLSWRSCPAAGQCGPAPPPGADPGSPSRFPGDASCSGPGQPARGCGGGRQRAARCLERPGEGARAHPPPCPPLPPPPRLLAPAPSWAARRRLPVPLLAHQGRSLAALAELRSPVSLQTHLALSLCAGVSERVCVHGACVTCGPLTHVLVPLACVQA